jgi:hypothetical protein
MGLFSFFSRREKPRSPSGISPHVDLERGIVCELGRDDRRETIERRLGTPTRKESSGLFYDQIGLQISVTKTGGITGWGIMFSSAILQYWRWGDRRTPGLTEPDVIKLLGAPTKVERDDEELMLTWERGGMTILVDYALDGTLNDVFVDFT